jgi:hypothetical protein
MKEFTKIGAASLGAMLLAFGSQAQIFTLADGNSVAGLNIGSSAGMYSWNVDGVNQLAQQWFWYRVGATGPESSIDRGMGLQSSTLTAPNQLTATYGSATNPLSLRISYTLTGGTAGSGASDMQEALTLVNHGNTTLSLHFFQYSDFDLGGTPGGDIVALRRNLSGRFYEALQSKGPITLNETVDTVATPGADHGEAGLFNTTLVRLNDGSPTTLNDVASAGPGDATWAFEWDLEIAAGASVVINKDKLLQVPEPSTAALGLLGLGAWFLRRKK